MAKKKTDEPKVGRPTDYKDDYARQAYIVCKNAPTTDVQLAELFGVSETTIYNWKLEHEEFVEAIKKSKDIYNIATAENCLQKRIEGYEYTETTIEKKGDKIVSEKTTTKQMAPDPTSTMFFLKNRDHKRWRDIKAIELTGRDGGKIETDNTTITAEMPAKEAASLYRQMLKDND